MMIETQPVLVASDDGAGIIAAESRAQHETATDRRMDEWLRLQRRERRIRRQLGEVRHEIETLDELLSGPVERA